MVEFVQYVCAESESQTWIDVRNWVEKTGQPGGDYAKAKYWNFVRHKPSSERLWSISEHGRAFLAGRMEVPFIAVVHRGMVIRWAGPMVNVNNYHKHDEIRPKRSL